MNLLIEQNKLKTLEQLNSYLRSWLEAYDQRVHRTTKQTPKQRYEAGASAVRRLAREELQALFLWEEERTVRKTAVIEIEGNRYDVDDSLRGSHIQVRYNPFDLTFIQVWKDGIRYADAKAAELRSQRHAKLPVEDPKPQAPTPVASYVERLKQDQEAKKRATLGTMSFAQLKKRENGGDDPC